MSNTTDITVEFGIVDEKTVQWLVGNDTIQFWTDENGDFVTDENGDKITIL